MKLVLASDGSSYSEVAAREIISTFRAQGCEVLVLQVIEPLIYSTPPQMAHGYAPEMTARLHDKLKTARESVSQTAEMIRRAGFVAEPRVIEGEIRGAILDVARNWHADLIVLGSHGEKGLHKFLIGSVAEFVARHAYCSVLIARTPLNA